MDFFLYHVIMKLSCLPIGQETHGRNPATDKVYDKSLSVTKSAAKKISLPKVGSKFTFRKISLSRILSKDFSVADTLARLHLPNKFSAANVFQTFTE